MTNLDETLEKLRRSTHNLAIEVKKNTHGPAWDIVTLLLDNVKSPSAILNTNHEIVFINKSTKNIMRANGIKVKDIIGKHARETGLCPQVDCSDCPVNKVLHEKKVSTIKYKGPLDKRAYEMICIPLVYNGISGVITLIGEEVKNGD